MNAISLTGRVVLVTSRRAALNASCDRDARRGRPEVAHKETLQMTRAHAEPRGEMLDRALVEKAVVDQAQGARNRRGHAGLPGAVSGRHLRHGRKPSISAAAADATKNTFWESAWVPWQIGRQ